MEKPEKPNWPCEAEYNGKEEGCGELILKLFLFFKNLPPGSRVCVTAYDKGAPAEIAAWCRSTNKELLHSLPPYFYIIKK